MSKKETEFWDQVEEKGEWINFGDSVPIDIIIENSTPETVEIYPHRRIYEYLVFFSGGKPLTNWGEALVLQVWLFPIDELTNGLRKQLRINSVRLQRALKVASPQGVPLRGYGYRIIRIGEGWATTYNVSFRGKFKIYKSGKVELVESP